MSPSIRFPEFTGEWEKCKIEDITDAVSSGKSKNHFSNGEYNLYGSTGIIGRTDKALYDGKLVLVARVGANAGFLQIINEPCGITDNTLILKPNQSFSQFDKLAAVYLQYLNKRDDGVLLLLNQLIQIRNRIMHPLSETEQLEEDGRCRPVNGALYKAKYFNRVPLFQDEHVASLMTQIIEAGLLKERTRDKKKELVIDKDVANSKTGIQLVFVCLKRFISSFE